MTVAAAAALLWAGQLRRARHAEKLARLERDAAERLAREEDGDIGFD